jgi:tetratricopeptide (TPR) repeat protein
MQAETPIATASQTMFFPRLRARAKWVFVFLVLVFGVGFVVFGVGSGGVGGISDLWNNGNNSSSSVSESKARDRIKKNPNDAKAYSDLADALQTKGDFQGSVLALKKFTQLKPNNVDGLVKLAGLYATLGARLQPQIQSLQTRQDPTLDTALNSGITVGKATVVAPDPILSASSAVTNNRLTKLYTQQQTNYDQSESTYKRIAKLQPSDAPTQLQLGQAAQQAGDVPTAIAAFVRFTRLAPDDPTTPLVKATIKQLRKASAASVSAG